MSLLPYGQGEVMRGTPVSAIKDVSHLAGVDSTEFRKGTVSAVADYGLFVNIEGVDGLLHISKIRYVVTGAYIYGMRDVAHDVLVPYHVRLVMCHVNTCIMCLDEPSRSVDRVIVSAPRA